MGAIYRRELRSYFTTMIGYVFITAVALFNGIFYWSNTLISGDKYYADILPVMMIIFVFVTPVLTMRSFAEERKAKTDQMLLTYPVSISAIVLGKFLSMMTVVAISLIPSCLGTIVIALFGGGAGSLLIDFSAIFAFYLMAGVFVAIGMFISSLTESQVTAVVVSIGTFLLLYFWGFIVKYISSLPLSSLGGIIALLVILCVVIYLLTRNKLVTLLVGGIGLAAALIVYFVNSNLYESLLPNMLGFLALVTPLNNFISSNLFDMGGLFLYISLAALFVFLTTQSIQKRRWS